MTAETASLPQGSLSVDVPAQAETPGSAGNMPANAVAVMVTPPSSIETVTNAAAFAGGEDSESDDALRARLLACYAEAPNGCNASWYRSEAMKTDGVDSACVVPRPNGAGTVAVYLGGRGCAPSAEIVKQVGDKLGALREIDVDLTVEAAQTVPVDVSVVAMGASGVPVADVKSACTAAVQDYFLSLGVGDPVIVSAIGSRMFQTGTIEDCSFSSGSRAMTSQQLAVCGKMTVTVI